MVVSTELFEWVSICVELPESLEVMEPEITVLRRGKLDRLVTLLLSALKSTEETKGGG